MQAIPESRQQTFEEIYGPPENFLEIEVCLDHCRCWHLHSQRSSKTGAIARSFARSKADLSICRSRIRKHMALLLDPCTRPTKFTRARIFQPSSSDTPSCAGATLTSSTSAIYSRGRAQEYVSLLPIACSVSATNTGQTMNRRL